MSDPNTPAADDAALRAWAAEQPVKDRDAFDAFLATLGQDGDPDFDAVTAWASEIREPLFQRLESGQNRGHAA